MKPPAIALLNPIIADKKYEGMFDGDPRIGELAEALVGQMDSSLFDEEVIAAVKTAGQSLSFSAMTKALEKLYDYADRKQIWLGDPQPS